MSRKIIFLLFFSMWCSFSWTQEPINAETRIVFVPITQIDPGVSAYVKRAIRNAISNKASRIVFEINIQESSDVLATIEIAEMINQLNGKDSSIKTIALVPEYAHSLGAFLVFACSEIYMMENAEIGLATQGISYASSPNFIKAFGDEMSALALNNHHNPDLALAMIDPEIELKEVTIAGEMAVISTEKARQLADDPTVGEVTEIATVVAKGDLLNLTASKAQKYSLSKTTQDNEQYFFKLMEITKPKVFREMMTWSERAVSWLTTWYISGLLLAVGFIALWIEFKIPGFGIFGVIGILCLSLLFVAKYMAGLAQVYEIVLIFVGIILLAVEFFILPGTFICGIVGVLCMGFGLILSFQSYVFPSLSKPWEIRDFVNNISAVLASLSFTMIGFLGMFQLLQNNKLFKKRFVLSEISPNDGLLSQQFSALTNLMGKSGVCDTELRPAGRVEIEKNFYDVVSTGDFIERGEKVRVIDVSSNRIMVEKTDE
ncbi:MAG: NfeD family protein [Planctomycetota bacterium]